MSNQRCGGRLLNPWVRSVTEDLLTRFSPLSRILKKQSDKRP
jgi:hypothetical protein